MSQTIVVLDSEFEQRYYRSPARAAHGMGYLYWESGTLRSKVLVYRLDEEATDAVNANLMPPPVNSDIQWTDRMLALFKKVWR